MKARLLSALLVICTFSLSAQESSTGTAYHVEWPGIHLQGTFTLDVGSELKAYVSTDAYGTYGGLSGQFNTVWTSVELNAQATRVDLTFIWDQGYTGFGYNAPPGVPWTSAQDAWSDLIEHGAAESVFITVVPEPSNLFLTCAGLLSFILLRCRKREATSALA